ncbi:MAG: DUF2953 domain-containing protein [FCB group bacterium]|nr:DUF2953 domain-containing protein [FCB group bacterium]
MNAAIIFWVLLLFFTGLLIVLFRTVQIQFRGFLTDLPSGRQWKGVVQVGWNRSGIKIRSQEGLLVQVGPYHHPWFSFKRPIKARSSRQRSKSFKRIRKRISTGEWIALIRKTLRFQSMTLTGQMGFTNPMTTGIVFGVLSALKHGFSSSGFQIQVEPQFSDLPNTKLEGKIGLQFRPIIVLWHGGRTLIKFRR